MIDLYFFQRIHRNYIKRVERLFFFNAQQHERYPEIEEAIETFGIPSIVTEGDLIRFGLSKTPDCLTLFATDGASDSNGEAGKLIAIAVFSRLSTDTIDIIHFAVDEQYSWSGKYARECVAIRVISRILEDCGRIKGVNKAVLHYANKKVLPMNTGARVRRHHGETA